MFAHYLFLCRGGMTPWNESRFCWKGFAHSKGWGKKSMNGHVVFINIWSFDNFDNPACKTVVPEPAHGEKEKETKSLII